MKRETKAYLILLAFSIAYDILFTIPPLLAHFGIHIDIIYRFFQPVCHQMDSRSFHIFGEKLAVCSRCAAIYYGTTIGILAYPFFKPLQDASIPRRIFLVAPLIVLIVDFAMNFVGPAQNTFASRTVTGGLLGIALAFFILPPWLSLFAELKIEGHPLHEK